MIARLFEHPSSLLVLVLLIVVLLGWKQLPDMARSLGRSSRILKSEVDEMRRESEASRPADEASKTEGAHRVPSDTDHQN